MTSLSPLPFRVRDRPLLAVLLVAVVATVVVASLAVLLLAGGGANDDDPGQRLGAVGVDNHLPEPYRVAFEVRRGVPGNSTTVASATLRVPAASTPTATDESGVASGLSVAGTVDADRSWAGPGNDTVRARLVDRDRWATLSLPDVEATDDDAGTVPCYDADALVAPSEPGGLTLRAHDCGRP
jgi:hypothetical protein